MDVDKFLVQPTWYSAQSFSAWSLFTSEFWSTYYLERCSSLLRDYSTVVDIGGGLRIDDTKSNDATNPYKTQLLTLTKRPDLTFITTDYTNKYNPDRVEDVHNLSFEDNSIGAIFCIALLEHVYDPKKACDEIMRTLQPGGKAFIYVPWLYIYHAHVNDYYDYFRYSKDGIAYLFREATSIELCPVRGVLETLFYMTPFTKIRVLQKICRVIDWKIPRFKVASERQTSGYFAVITK